jgi:outer membrane protein assembly factor BamB
MKNSDLVFIGIKGTVLALNRATGEQVWTRHLTLSTIAASAHVIVYVVVQNEAILASYNGEVFSLDPLTGDVRWHNPLKGFGIGLATIAMEPNPGNDMTPVLAEKLRQVQSAGAAGAAAIV